MPDVVRRRARSRTTWRSKTKLDLAAIGRRLITTAVEDKIPGEVVLADCFYGVSSDLRNVIRIYGFDLAALPSTQSPGCGCSTRDPAVGEARPVGAQQLGVDLGPKAFRRITWREGTKGSRKKLSSRFCFRRAVKVANDDGTEARDKEPLWLVH